MPLQVVAANGNTELVGRVYEAVEEKSIYELPLVCSQTPSNLQARSSNLIVFDTAMITVWRLLYTADISVITNLKEINVYPTAVTIKPMWVLTHYEVYNIGSLISNY